MRKLPSLSLILLFFCLEANATSNKFDVAVGYYAVSAKTATGSGSNSGIGLYQFNFRRAFTPRFEFAVGYTIYFSSLITGDSGSGLDLGVNYFPFSLSGPVETGVPGVSFKVEELWRPYMGATFNQRNFQSVQATYTGFGIVAGVERVLTESLNFTTSLRYIVLNGARGASGTEMNLAAGLGFKF